MNSAFDSRLPVRGQTVAKPQYFSRVGFNLNHFPTVNRDPCRRSRWAGNTEPEQLQTTKQFYNLIV